MQLVYYYCCYYLHDWHGVYLYLIFEMSIWEFITNSKKKSISKLDFFSSSNLIFAGYTGSKNQVWTRQKIKFVSKSISFRVWNWKKIEWHSIFQKLSMMQLIRIKLLLNLSRWPIMPLELDPKQNIMIFTLQN